MYPNTRTFLMENDAARHAGRAMQPRWVVDDFEDSLGSTHVDHELVPEWMGFTDQGMGGHSTADVLPTAGFRLLSRAFASVFERTRSAMPNPPAPRNEDRYKTE